LWAATADTKAAEVTLELPAAVRFDLVRLREPIRLGQRIREFTVEYSNGGSWVAFQAGTSIGICRILRSPQPVTATKVRLRITDAAASPALTEFGLFLEAAIA
jgi:alpha-L-fucosidase